MQGWTEEKGNAFLFFEKDSGIETLVKTWNKLFEQHC